MKSLLSPPTLRKILRFIGPQAVTFLALGILAGLALSGIEIALAGSIQLFLSALGLMSAESAGLPAWVPHYTLAQILVGIALLGLIRGAITWLSLYLSGSMMELQALMQRVRVFRWAFYNQSTSSGELNTLVSRTSYVGTVLASLQAIASPLITCAAIGVALLYTAPSLTLVVAAFLVVIYLALRVLDKRISSAGAAFNDIAARHNRLVYRGIRNLILIHIYGVQERELEQAIRTTGEMSEHALVYQKLNALKFAIPPAFGIVLICVLTYQSQKAGTLAPAKLLSYFYLFNRFIQSFAEISRQLTTIRFNWPQLASLAKWWADHSHDGVRNVRLQHAGKKAEPFMAPVGWSLTGVGFEYAEGSGPVLGNVNLAVKAGEAVVIRGPSGVGKSTLLYLLLGNLDPTRGKVELLVDGKPCPLDASLKQRLLQSVGYVGPESFLVEGTVLENIVYGLEREASTSEVKEALVKAECQFVFDMPEGLNHRLTEQGQGLSAGQKQRLSLARALLRNPKVLVLDEATSNLDFEMEARLVKTLAGLKRQMTIVAATHRVALLELADERIELG